VIEDTLHELGPPELVALLRHFQEIVGQGAAVFHLLNHGVRVVVHDGVVEVKHLQKNVSQCLKFIVQAKEWHMIFLYHENF
jgi:hypothetical protein